LAGHDNIGLNHLNTGITKLRKYFNVDIGKWSEYMPTDYRNYVDYDATWCYNSTKVKVEKSGLLTNFPYELSVGEILTVPVTNVASQAACGNVWMTLVNGTDNYNRQGSINNYYNAGGTRNIEVHFVGVFMESTKRLAYELHLEEKVIFHGKMFGAALDDLYNNSDLGIGALAHHRV